MGCGGTPKWSSWKQSQRRKGWHNAVPRLSDSLFGFERRIWSLEERHSCNLFINTLPALSKEEFGVLIQVACHFQKAVTEARCRNTSPWKPVVWWAQRTMYQKTNHLLIARAFRFFSKLGTKRQLSPFESIYATTVHCTYICNLILTFRMSQMMLVFSQLMTTGKVS